MAKKKSGRTRAPKKKSDAEIEKEFQAMVKARREKAESHPGFEYPDDDGQMIRKHNCHGVPLPFWPEYEQLEDLCLLYGIDFPPAGAVSPEKSAHLSFALLAVLPALHMSNDEMASQQPSRKKAIYLAIQYAMTHVPEDVADVLADFIRNIESRIIPTELDELRENTPDLDTESGQWVRSSKAAKREGRSTETLKKKRARGEMTSDRLFGKDKDGRIWAKPSTTPNSHAWYYLPSLKSEK